MAEPIPFGLSPRDPREALHHRLENAPREHAEALLAAYDVLQGLHDKGLLDMARGALGSSDKVLQILVDAANEPEAIRGMRNLMILAKIAGALEPELLESLARALPEGLAQAKTHEPPGLWELSKKLLGEDTRRAVAAMAAVLEAFGRNLRPGEKL